MLLTAPSPVGVLEDGCRDVGSDESIDDKRRRSESRHQTTPFEGCDIGDDDLREQLKATE